MQRLSMSAAQPGYLGDLLWVNVPRIQDHVCGNWTHMTEDMSLVPVADERYLTDRQQCDAKIAFYHCAQVTRLPTRNCSLTKRVCLTEERLFIHFEEFSLHERSERM